MPDLKLLGAVATGLLCLSACAPSPPEHVHDSMKGVVAPQAQIIWDISNRLLNDEGAPDSSRLQAADWKRIEAAARQIQGRSTAFVDARQIIVAASGVKIQDEGAPEAASSAQVLSYINADRAGFNRHAQELAAISGEIAKASQTKDAVHMADATGRLDQVCESCHTSFWYPQQASK